MELLYREHRALITALLATIIESSIRTAGTRFSYEIFKRKETWKMFLIFETTDHILLYIALVESKVHKEEENINQI